MSNSIYRSISNSSLHLTLLKNCISLQLVDYLDTKHANAPLQSAASGSNTRLLTYVFSAVDQGRVTLLALFAVSAAFDAVDHAILLERLSKACRHC